MKRINWNGYWYEYQYKLARHRIDVCLATIDPEQYCNGYYLFSTKDPGSGKAFVIIDSNDPQIKITLMELEFNNQ